MESVNFRKSFKNFFKSNNFCPQPPASIRRLCETVMKNIGELAKLEDIAKSESSGAAARRQHS